MAAAFRLLRLPSALRAFLCGEAAGGVVLMIAAAAAKVVAGAALADTFFLVLHAQISPLSVLH